MSTPQNLQFSNLPSNPQFSILSNESELTAMEQSSSILNPNPNPNHPSNPNAYTLDSPHPVYAMAFSSSTSSPFRLALGSFLEEYNNRVDIVTFDEESTAFRLDPALSFDHPYPATKLMFHPRPIAGSGSSLIASSGDFLRLWQVQHDVEGGGKSELRSVLNNSKSSDFCAPLTSFDWNDAEPRRIGTSSIDTTCTVWDIERGAVETQLIAHDKEVYDIAWGEAGVFASVSADGSVRIFDLRDKEHSTIVYESPRPDTPLLRLAWNKSDLRYMAALQMDSSRIIILDIRSPAFPVAELQRHRACVNSLAWAPQAPRHLCSAGDDGQALIWEVPAAVTPGTMLPPEGVDPLLTYSAGAEINQLQWSAAHPDWIGVAFANKVQLLRV